MDSELIDEQPNIISNLPFEVVLNEILTRLDFKSFVNYCSLNQNNRKKCEDVNTWRYLRIDHRDFQDLLLYLAYNKENRLFKLLVDNLDNLNRVADDRILNKCYIYFTEHNNVNMSNYTKNRVKNPSNLASEAQHGIKMAKIQVKNALDLVYRLDTSRYVDLNFAFSGATHLLWDNEYTPDLFVANVPFANYKIIYTVDTQNGRVQGYSQDLILAALVRLNNMTAVREILEADYTYRMAMGIRFIKVFIAEASIEQIVANDRTIELINYSDTRFPPYVDETFYNIAESLGGGDAKVTFHRFLTLGYRSTDPYQWISFVEKHIYNKDKGNINGDEIDLHAIYVEAIENAQKCGYDFWASVILDALHKLEI